jgi:hypothetical protein
MFTHDFIIDTFQNGKKQFVNTFVTHDGIKKALNEFVDGQTAYTKSAVKAATEVNNRITEESTKAFTELTKFDVSKFFKVSK